MASRPPPRTRRWPPSRGRCRSSPLRAAPRSARRCTKSSRRSISASPSVTCDLTELVGRRHRRAGLVLDEPAVAAGTRGRDRQPARPALRRSPSRRFRPRRAARRADFRPHVRRPARGGGRGRRGVGSDARPRRPVASLRRAVGVDAGSVELAGWLTGSIDARVPRRRRRAAVRRRRLQDESSAPPGRRRPVGGLSPRAARRGDDAQPLPAPGAAVLRRPAPLPALAPRQRVPPRAAPRGSAPTCSCAAWSEPTRLLSTACRTACSPGGRRPRRCWRSTPCSGADADDARRHHTVGRARAPAVDRCRCVRAAEVHAAAIVAEVLGPGPDTAPSRWRSPSPCGPRRGHACIELDTIAGIVDRAIAIAATDAGDGTAAEPPWLPWPQPNEWRTALVSQRGGPRGRHRRRRDRARRVSAGAFGRRVYTQRQWVDECAVAVALASEGWAKRRADGVARCAVAPARERPACRRIDRDGGAPDCDRRRTGHRQDAHGRGAARR